MKRASFSGTTLVLFAGVAGMQRHSAAPANTESLMKRELQDSQKVLESVAIPDFKLIARHADELIQLSRLAEWRAVKTPLYAVYSNDFRRSAGALIENARK